jgi:hypothetical protein
MRSLTESAKKKVSSLSSSGVYASWDGVRARTQPLWQIQVLSAQKRLLFMRRCDFNLSLKTLVRITVKPSCSQNGKALESSRSQRICLYPISLLTEWMILLSAKCATRHQINSKKSFFLLASYGIIWGKQSTCLDVMYVLRKFTTNKNSRLHLCTNCLQSLKMVLHFESMNRVNHNLMR